MNEPLLQADAQIGKSSLWDKAPGWRNLTITAAFLTVTAVALPLYLPQTDVPAIPRVKAAPVKVMAVPVQQASAKPAIQPPQSAFQPAAPTGDHAAAPVRTASLPAHSQRVPMSQEAAPQVQQQACSILLPNTPIQMSGTVIGFIPHDQSLRIFSNTERNSGGAVNPAYLNDERVMVQPDPGTNGGSRNPVVPAGLTVAIGDHVTYQTPYRDPGMPCGFFPSQINANQGPATASATPPNAEKQQ
jgi:hypothetical protein